MNEEERVQIRDARKHCFFIVDNVIIDHYASIIGPFPTLVYSALCRHADYSTRETFPSLSTIAKELGISRMTVIRAIQCLVTHGLIARKSRKSKSGDPDTNIYIILEPWGSHSQRLPQKTEMLRQGYTSNEVVTESDQVVTESDQVVTESDQGSHSQRLGVVTEVDPNNTQLEQDSSNKKEDSPPSPPLKVTKAANEYDRYPLFGELWSIAVTRPTGSKGIKQESLSHWKQYHLEEHPELAEQVISAYAYQKTTPKWQEGGGEYVPELQRWLKGKRWEGVDLNAASIPQPRTYQPGDMLPDGTRMGKII